MKTNVPLRIFTSLCLLISMTVFTLSQNVDLPPDAALSYSPFSPPQNLGFTVNMTGADELALITPSGLSLYFASDRPGGLGGRDIYVSQRPTRSSAWGAPQNLGATVNTNGAESPGGISPDGREMFINSQRPGGSGGVDIWVMSRIDPNDDFGWTTPVNLGAVVNSAFFDQNGNYFVDPASGTGTLYFTSDRDSAAVNVKDVYQSTRNADGTFNPPTAVTELNSTFDEQRTAISHTGLEIFLSSNRTGGNSGIFVSTRGSSSAPWKPPVFIADLSIEGSAIQPVLSLDGTTLYFTSGRPGGSGGLDLYTAIRVNINRGRFGIDAP